MFKNYFKVALRNLYRYKGFSGINILGLAIGITGCLLIALFVWDELQYDKFVKDGDRIYRIYNQGVADAGSNVAAVTPPAFAPYMQQQFPEVEGTTRIFMWSGKMLLENGEKRAYEEKGFIADSTFFSMFPLQFLKGDAKTALDGPTSVVLSEELAAKYFGSEDPIGKTLKLDKTDFAVSGVVASLPEHFHLSFNYMLPFSAAGIPAERMQKWGWTQFYTYVKLKQGSDVAALQNKLQEAVKKQAADDPDEGEATSLPRFQALKDIHLGSANFEYDNAKRGNESYVKGLTIIAIFVLLIACFNFINLATARSFRRAKEIGVRKVIGADRKQLIIQFTGETVLISFIAIIIGVLATLLILPSLNNFTGKAISFNPITDPLLGLLIVGVALVIGIISGIYPALVMSGFQPIKVLKGLKPTGGSGSSAATLRQSLVIVQFALSALLIVSTVIVYRQMNYLHQKDLGFSKDQIVYFNVQGKVAESPQVFKEELKRSAGVVSVTGGYGLPGDQFATDGITVPGKNGDKEQRAIHLIVDHDYIKTMGAQVIAGRDFSTQYATDVKEAFIINETAVRELGFGTPEAAVGQRLHWKQWNADSLNPYKQGKIVGVVKDFHVKSLHEKISTTVIHIYPSALAKMAVKVKAADLPATLDFIKATWNKFSPDYPLDYKFLDENFAAMYGSEDKLSALLWIFTAMAIFVGCLGLFGLAAFSAEQRVKEIGIRKVLGASVLNIVAMLSKTFLKPVAIASLISFPIAWWAMNNWLKDFEYRIAISWWVFAIAGIAALLIALITVSFQSIKAATSNPVKNLRTE
ncbi:MAG: FtsX-like permease family protein [Flaviaesturariibacter sp.]|nr:FtsX-like permease family protein [Flaviaesturariibacter sp.]